MDQIAHFVDLLIAIAISMGHNTALVVQFDIHPSHICVWPLLEYQARLLNTSENAPKSGRIFLSLGMIATQNVGQSVLNIPVPTHRIGRIVLGLPWISDSRFKVLGRVIPMRETSANLRQLLFAASSGDNQAAIDLMDQFGPQLIAVIRRRLAPEMRTHFDSADFAQAVWASLFLAKPTEAKELSANELLRRLAAIARNKVTDEFRSDFKPTSTISNARWDK